MSYYNLFIGQDVTGETFDLQEKTIIPVKEGNIVTPDVGFDGLAKITIPMDSDYIPENIRQNIDIWGVVGTMVPVNNYTLSIATPSAVGITISTPTGYTGLQTVRILSDADFIASNIKYGTNIWGITGSHNPPPQQYSFEWWKQAYAAAEVPFGYKYAGALVYVADNLNLGQLIGDAIGWFDLEGHSGKIADQPTYTATENVDIFDDDGNNWGKGYGIGIYVNDNLTDKITIPVSYNNKVRAGFFNLSELKLTTLTNYKEYDWREPKL